jgi:hypothetical protein
MIRVVHLFDVKPGVSAPDFLDWLDATLSRAARDFGCVDRSTWMLVDGFTGGYMAPKPATGRPKYVNEAFWEDSEGPAKFRTWLTQTPEGKAVHDRWFGSIQNHTVLRYAKGWARMDPDE